MGWYYIEINNYSIVVKDCPHSSHLKECYCGEDYSASAGVIHVWKNENNSWERLLSQFQPFFSEEKRKLSIIYIYPNQVFVEKTSHAELKNDVFNLAELNRIVHCLLNIYIYRLSSPCCSFTDLLKTCQIIQQLLKTCNNWPKDDKVHCTRNKDYVQLFSKKINV